MAILKPGCGKMLPDLTHDHRCYCTKDHTGKHACYCGIRWDDEGRISIPRKQTRRR